jgi:hypothetical protein
MDKKKFKIIYIYILYILQIHMHDNNKSMKYAEVNHGREEIPINSNQSSYIDEATYNV